MVSLRFSPAIAASGAELDSSWTGNEGAPVEHAFFHDEFHSGHLEIERGTEMGFFKDT